MKKKLSAMVMGLVLTTGCAMASEYTMRSGDQISIVVTQEPSISTSVNASGTMTPYLVRPDGRVSIPLAGEINANGMTVAQFTEELRTRLSKYIVDPDVAVKGVKIGNLSGYLFCGRNRPGAFGLTHGHTGIGAIGAASGFNWDTAKKKIYLIRQDRPKELIAINLNRMLETGDMSENYEMREGDMLYLTKNSRINFSRDIAPIFSSNYMITEAKQNINDD